MNQKIHFKNNRQGKRRKYVLTEPMSQQISVGMKLSGVTVQPKSRVTLRGGVLYIDKGYSWDGATGIPDRTELMRASLVHDALYKLMRKGLLNSEFRKDADRLFLKICVEEGVAPFVSRILYAGIRLFGWIFV